MKKQIIAVVAAGVLAVLGVIALVMYANDADDRALDGAETVSVLRATVDVPARTPVQDLAGMVESVEIVKSALVPDAISSLEGLEGTVTATALTPGDQLSAAKLVAPGDARGAGALPAGMQELTIAAGGIQLAGGTVAPGDLLGVFAIYDGVSNPVNKVLVLKVADAAPDADGNMKKNVTVAVDTLTAQQIIHAQTFGSIWMTQQNEDTDSPPNRTVQKQDVAP